MWLGWAVSDILQVVFLMNTVMCLARACDAHDVATAARLQCWSAAAVAAAVRCGLTKQRAEEDQQSWSAVVSSCLVWLASRNTCVLAKNSHDGFGCFVLFCGQVGAKSKTAYQC